MVAMVENPFVYLTPLGLDKRNIAKQIVLDFNETIRKKLKESDIQTFQKVFFVKVLKIVNKTIEEKFSMRYTKQQ